MEELLLSYSKKHAPHMNQNYHNDTVRLMLHMLEINKAKKNISHARTSRR